MKINGIDVIEDFIPKSNTYARPGYFMKPEYITIHNTGNRKKSADAKMHTEYIDAATSYVSWHFTVDDKAIYQELPCNESAWHAGDGRNGPGNRKSIAIEICENEGIDYAKAEENAIALIIYLMKQYNIPLENVVPHKVWSGKHCPHKILDYGWDKFIDRIEKKMEPTIEEAIAILNKADIIGDTEYWLKNARIDHAVLGHLAGALIIKTAKYIKNIENNKPPG